MQAEELKALQAPLKEQYKTSPEAAEITLNSTAKIGEGITCRVDTAKGMIEAGLHPATGGDGLSACSGDMLLDALTACAGVTLNAVATAIGIELRDATIRAEGDLDFRGTLAIDKEANVGFKNIRVSFDLDCDAPADQLESLIKLTERYCVVFQTISKTPDLSVSYKLAEAA